MGVARRCINRILGNSSDLQEAWGAGLEVTPGIIHTMVNENVADVEAGRGLAQPDHRPGSATSGVCPPARVPVGPYCLELLAPNSEPQ